MSTRFLTAWLGLAVAASQVTVPGHVSSPAPATGRHSAMIGAPADSLVGVFEGRTPCGEHLVEFAGYGGPACEKMKWWLAFYRSANTGEPTRYEFRGTRVTREGIWQVVHGTPGHPDATVYRLSTDLSPDAIFLLRADHNLLLFLDSSLRLMVGDASWSYTLSRTR